MEKIMPIGTIINKNNNIFCIVGYGDIEVNDKTICGYKMVPYPIGYLDIQRVFFISCEEPFVVISEGYSDSLSQKYLELIQKIFLLSEKIDRKQLDTMIKEYKRVVSNGEL